MKEIELTPQDFSFPNFCFEKKFKEYLFLQSGILAEGIEAENYFFKILQILERTFSNENTKIKWDLFIPEDFVWPWGDAYGNSGKYKISKGTIEFKLSELRRYFFEEFYEKKQSHFINLVPQFWIEMQSHISVYTLYNSEIIVIGTDFSYDVNEIIDSRFAHFFYPSFDAYIDHWGQVFRWTKSQITFLKKQFSSNSTKEK